MIHLGDWQTLFGMIGLALNTMGAWWAWKDMHFLADCPKCLGSGKTGYSKEPCPRCGGDGIWKPLRLE